MISSYILTYDIRILLMKIKSYCRAMNYFHIFAVDKWSPGQIRPRFCNFFYNFEEILEVISIRKLALLPSPAGGVAKTTH